jgi:small subunit ribosomal protein S16
LRAPKPVKSQRFSPTIASKHPQLAIKVSHMSVSIRLSRQGTKKRPFYRVVVTDSRSPRGGKFLENIGTFDPAKEIKDASLKIDHERLSYWRATGATPSDTLTKLLKELGKHDVATAASAK